MIDRFLKLLTLGAVLVQSFIVFSQDYWFFELFSHYRIYYILLGLLLTVALMLKGLWKWTLILALLIAMNLAPLDPYLGKTQQAESSDFKIYSQNVFYLNSNIQEYRSLIQEEDPDLFIILEASQEWHQEAQAYLPTYPYQAFTTDSGVSGIFMASKTPGTFEEITLFEEDVKSHKISIRGSNALLFHPEDSAFSVLGVHPFAPMSRSLAQGRNAAYKTLSEFANTQEDLIVLGDFNSSPWSPLFQNLLETSGLEDARIGFGLTPTWHAHNLLFNIPIDHALVSPGIEVSHFYTSQKSSSDHLGIVLEIKL